ncbi:MAG TPA: hypothetical protein VER58_16035 [Thermoanaerobaculia bacterium]|nr:hypothetical protein [Thermoanaerobaculia bacterium]
MAHFDIPLDLPHAGRLADRILALLEKHTEEMELEVPEVMDTADKLSSYLFRNAGGDDNPPNAMEVRDQAADLGRQLVDTMEAAHITGDRLGQLVRNLFECLELGKEGSEISLRAGENPNSLQRPI